MVDIREYYLASDKEYRPTRKGVCLPLEQWQELKEKWAKVDELIEQHRKE